MRISLCFVSAAESCLQGNTMSPQGIIELNIIKLQQNNFRDFVWLKADAIELEQCKTEYRRSYKVLHSLIISNSNQTWLNFDQISLFHNSIQSHFSSQQSIHNNIAFYSFDWHGSSYHCEAKIHQVLSFLPLLMKSDFLSRRRGTVIQMEREPYQWGWFGKRLEVFWSIFTLLFVDVFKSFPKWY